MPRRRLRNHRHGIVVMTQQGEVRLLPIGYVAAALCRTRGSVLHYESIGLLPRAPFVINADKPNIRRWLYPEDYVNELGRITARHYPGRLERQSWEPFQKHMFDAYKRLVMPLLSAGVSPPVEIELIRDRGLAQDA